MAAQACEPAAQQDRQCTANAPAPSKHFVALSYNIFSRSLGSNCIPWVMATSSAELLQRVEGAVGVAWRPWKRAKVYPEYKRHFHKNLLSGDYTTMRRLWSARRLASQADIPPTLTGINFHASDQVTYTDDKGEQAVATTMRGLLRAEIAKEDLGLQLFEHLMELEGEVYDWATRGPRIFREIVSSRPLQPVPGAPGKSGDTNSAPPDVVMLQEYDVHTIKADYRGIDSEETFAEAMDAEGYTGILFKDPLKGRTPPSGIGIFWRRGAFRLAGSNASAPELPRFLELECDESWGNSVRNVDFMEHWHPLRAAGPATRELMPDADRRHLASVELEHLESGRKLRVVSAHLMTTSRDSKSTNEYPGEVRAGELSSLREEISRSGDEGEAVLVAGDFNTEAKDVDVFTGRLQSTQTGSPLQVTTGLEDLGEGSGRLLRWRAGKSVSLREAFEPVHRWGEGVGSHRESGHCTSSNAERCEWIDYIWHSEASLQPLALSDCSSPEGPIPDREHGSDHLPVAARFAFA